MTVEELVNRLLKMDPQAQALVSYLDSDDEAVLMLVDTVGTNEAGVVILAGEEIAFTDEEEEPQ
jgi:hypothetical protein